MKNTLLLLFFITSLGFGQCPPGDVTLSTQAEVDEFVAMYPTCDTISGHLNITGTVNDLSALDYILYIEGDLVIRGTELTTVSNFDNTIEIWNTIEFSYNSVLSEITGFNELNHLSMLFLIENNTNLQTIDGFNNATSVSDIWIGLNPSLESIVGFSGLETVDVFFNISESPLLTIIPSFNNLTYIGWGIQFYNTGLVNISGFDSLSFIGDVDPTVGFGVGNNLNLVSITGFNCLVTLGNDLIIQNNPSLESIRGLCSLESAQGLTIRNNDSITSLNGLQSLVNVPYIDINNNPQLSDCNGLCNLFSVTGTTGTISIIDNSTGCNSEAEINTTNCTPFEVLNCTSLTTPIDGAINIAVNTDLSWLPITGASSYLVSIGTTSGGIDIANRLDVGNVTIYDLPNDLPENTVIFVKVIPYSTTGQAKCCVEESFTTENTTTLDCTTLSNPLNNATNVPISSNISWNAVTNATGYIINIGSTSGGTDIANSIDVGNVTTYNPAANFLENTQIFVTVIPYNTSEQAIGCIEESFITEITLPSCTSLLNPLNGAISVAITSDISWGSISNAIGYIISIGTSSGGIDIVDNLDVGDVTSYNTTVDFTENTEYFINILPYNSVGQALNCTEESFITEAGGVIPNCTNLSNPIDGFFNVSVTTNLSWNISDLATGYILNIGTTSLGSEIIDNLDIGNNVNYNPIEDFPEGIEIYVTIIPYNLFGQPIECLTESFTTENISVSAPSFFTPNNDGFNDRWLVTDLNNEIITINIFDRFGKLIKQLSPLSNGWDGTFNGDKLPNSSYWYSINKTDGSSVKGRFALKR